MTLSDPCEEAASVGTPFVMPHYFLDVRYWHLADITLCTAHVCFWGESGHALLHCKYTLMTQSGHGPRLNPFRITGLGWYDPIPPRGVAA